MAIGTNNFLIFDENKQNMVTDTSYAAVDYRLNGAREGIAPSNVHNKLYYQTSIMCAALAQVLANRGYNVSDLDFTTLMSVVNKFADVNDFLALTGGALTGTLTLVADPTNALEAATKQYVDKAVPTGAVFYFPRTTAPTGYLIANGAVISRAAYPTLWIEAQASGNLLNEAQWANNNFGAYSTGDGSTTFRIPNLQDRMPLAKGATHNTLGNVGGEDVHVLTVKEIPSHKHVSGVPYGPNVYGAASISSAPRYTGNADIDISPLTSEVGSGESHNNMPPYVTLLACIKY